MTKGCHLSKGTAAWRSGKTTDRYRKAVHNGNIRILRNSVRYDLPQFLLHLPKIGCLSCKGGPGDFSQPRKPICIMPTKVSEYVAFCINSKKFAHHFHREHFTVSQGRLGTPFPQPLAG